MSIVVRNALESDCPRMMELVKELAVYEKAPDEVTVSFEHFVESGFGPHPVWWAIVAEENNLIHGFALYYIRYSTWKGQAMYLEDILVTESQRGRGIGGMLFEKLFEIAREKNLPRIVWQVLDWNETAINFYKKYNASFDGEWVNCAVNVD